MENSHWFLVGPPLVIISLFCFGLVLLHPSTTRKGYPVLVSHAIDDSTSTSSSLPAISVFSDPQPLPVLLPTVAVALPPPVVSTAASSQSSSNITIQPAGAAINQLQATAPANQAAPIKLTRQQLSAAKFAEPTKKADKNSTKTKKSY